MSITIIQQEDAMAEQDRKARPFVVGEAANPGVIERFRLTHCGAARCPVHEA